MLTMCKAFSGYIAYSNSTVVTELEDYTRIITMTSFKDDEGETHCAQPYSVWFKGRDDVDYDSSFSVICMDFPERVLLRGLK